MNLNRKARIGTWAAGLAAVFTLSACVGNPGTAVSVGEVSYSNTDIAVGAGQISELAGRPVRAFELAGAVARVPHIIEIAKQNDVVVSDAQITDLLKEQAAQAGNGEQASELTSSEDLSSAARDYIRLTLIEAEINKAITDPAKGEEINAQYVELLQNTPVEINPRYGTIDENRNLVPVTFADVVNSHTQGAR